MKAAFDKAHAAIDFLSRHRLNPSPTHYHLALMYLDAPDGDLAREIERLTDGGLRLGEEQTARLVATHIGSAATVAARESEVRQHADTLQTITGDAHDLTSDMSRDLSAIGDDAAGRDTLVERMIDRLAQAERQLGDMRADIADLQDRLHDQDRPGGSASHDTLTETVSRHGADAAIAGLAAHPLGYVIALCILDDLIAINERYGRSVGDNVLRALASSLSRSCPGHEVIRWSGNEFVVVMKGTSLAAARAMMEEARTTMAARTFRLRGTGAPIGTITMSAGLSAGRGESAEGVIVRARAQVQAATDEGGDVVKG